MTNLPNVFRKNSSKLIQIADISCFCKPSLTLSNVCLLHRLIKLIDELRGPVQSEDEYEGDVPSSEPSFDEAFRRSFSSHKDFLRAFKEDLEEHEKKRAATKCPIVGREGSMSDI